MNVLALDTSTPRAVLAVARDDGRRFGSLADPLVRQGRSLIPDIRGLLASAELAWDGLHALAVGLGPGSFTGLRIGVTAAKALAFARGLPLFALDSLELRARGVHPATLKIVVLTDARRGEVLVTRFERPGVGLPPVRVGSPAIVRRADWQATADPEAVVLDPIPGQATAEGVAWPDPADLAAMAAEAARSGRPVELFPLEPEYLRRSAAEEKADAPTIPR